MSLYIFLSICLSLVFFMFFLIKKFALRKSSLIPPSPPKLPIIGNMHQLGELPHRSLRTLAKKYGHVMFLQLGNVPTIIISSSEAAKEAMKDHDLDCCSRPSMLGVGRLTQNYKDIAFTPYSDYWREVRKICVLQLFSAKQVIKFRPIREDEVFSMIESISLNCEVDMSEKMYALTASITFKTAFGRSFKGSVLDNKRFQELIHEAEVVFGSFAAADFFPYVGWIVDRFSGLHGKIEKVFHQMDEFFNLVLDDHMDPERFSKDDQDEDIIDVMLAIEKNNIDSGSITFTKANIKGILINIFLGGIDTGAITMIWALTELIRNPKILKKAQNEVRSCIKNKDKVTEQDLDQLEYLKMVVKETFRLYPPGPLLLPRQTINHCKIQGYDIYPKTLMYINAYAIGRDSKIWENPEEFSPERFSNSCVDYKGQHFELLPFGAGRRICPAINMAIPTIELALANLLYCFDWKLPNGMKEEDVSVEETAGLTICKKVPLKLVPVKV